MQTLRQPGRLAPETRGLALRPRGVCSFGSVIPNEFLTAPGAPLDQYRPFRRANFDHRPGHKLISHMITYIQFSYYQAGKGRSQGLSGRGRSGLPYFRTGFVLRAGRSAISLTANAETRTFV
jgi:hypothetical protein